MSRLATALLTLFLIAPIQSYAQDQVIEFSESDQIMNAAIAEARASFPLFMKQYYQSLGSAASSIDDFSVKVEMLTTDGTNTEHIWVAPFIEIDSGFSGFLSNDPVALGCLSFGSEISFSQEQISDWSYMRDGRAYGNYTTRVLIPSLDFELARELTNYVSPKPLPDEWLK